MGKLPLTTKQDTYTKSKSTIFNFPLSKAGRNQLEELADIWGTTLAGTIRRSLEESYKSAKANTDTQQEIDVRQSKIATLEALLAMHRDLSVIKSNTAKILEVIPTAENMVDE
jgi:hypothetical protein